MSKKKKKRISGEIEYWQPTSDMLISLLLILLLVILLLGLYLNHMPETYYPARDDGAGESTTEYDGHEDHREDHMFDNPMKDQNDNGGGAGDNTGTDKGDKPGEYPDEGVKSAVHVTVIDAQTRHAVREAGVTFELYSDKNALQSLNTYYPEMITYREFATTEDGVFYLPEKIWPGKYIFRAKTEAAGYDMADDQAFKIDKLYDWPKPLEVKIPVYPSRNVVRVQLNDKTTGLGVTGGTFNVIAAENITTADGTLRYKAGDVATVITLDEKGYGESEPVYLGKYTIRQQQVPEYYASVLEDVKAEVGKKTKDGPGPHKILTEKSKISIRVVDELHHEQPLEGVTYEINCDGQPPKTYTTDRSGSILLENLTKNVSYHIKQTGKIGDYLLDTKIHDVAVDAGGRINAEPAAEVELTNRMLRVSIGLTDALLKSQVSDVNLAIYDESDKVLKTWTTTGTPVTMTDLPPGNYQVVRDGKKSESYLLTVENTAKPQEFTITVFTWRSAVVIAIGVVVLAIVIAGLRIIIGGILKNRKKRNPTKQKPDQTGDGSKG